MNFGAGFSQAFFLARAGFVVRISHCGISARATTIIVVIIIRDFHTAGWASSQRLARMQTRAVMLILQCKWCVAARA